MSTQIAEPPEVGARRRIHWLVPVSALAALALSAWFAVSLLRAVPPPPLDVGPTASVLRVPLPLPAFALSDHAGRPFDEKRLEGHWSFLFFGFTSCPEVCPVTLGTFRDVRANLAAGDARDLADVQFVFVSVDPERDSLERLSQFVPYFHPDFIGATGDPAALEPLTKALGIYHAKAEGVGEGDYLIDHTTSVMLIDPQRQLHAIFGFPHDPDAVADAFREIRRHGERG